MLSIIKELTARCFEIDWNYITTNITSSTISSEESDIKVSYLASYPLLKYIFKYLSSLTPVGGVFVLTQKHFFQFLELCGFSENNKNMNQSDLELKYSKVKRRGSQLNAIEAFTTSSALKLEEVVPLQENSGLNNSKATKSSKVLAVTNSLMNIVKKTQIVGVYQTPNKEDLKNRNPSVNLNPAKGLTRPQFMEILLRVLIDYSKQQEGIVSGSTVGERIINLIKDKIAPNFVDIVGFSKWRESQLFTWECDRILRKYRFGLQKIFDLYANSLSRDLRFETKKKMWLEEFLTMFRDCRLLEENHFAEKDVYMCFNLSTPTNAEEMSSDRHLVLSFLEFLEAIARAADKMSLVPLEENVIIL